MKTEKKEPKCFIIMPISMRARLLAEYEDDKNHFSNILEYLFIPSLREIGYVPLPPVSSGSDLIHADIIAKLVTADLVLCDMSTLNSNVFFELGIRTAINKPICLVVDDKTPKIPFDTSIINRHTYPSKLLPWNINEAQTNLIKHLKSSIANAGDDNSLWKYFGTVVSGDVNSLKTSQDDKLAIIIRSLEALSQKSNKGIEWGPEVGWSGNPVKIHFPSQKEYIKTLSILPELRKLVGNIPIRLRSNTIELEEDFWDDKIHQLFTKNSIKAEIYSVP